MLSFQPFKTVNGSKLLVYFVCKCIPMRSVCGDDDGYDNDDDDDMMMMVVRSLSLIYGIEKSIYLPDASLPPETSPKKDGHSGRASTSPYPNTPSLLVLLYPLSATLSCMYSFTLSFHPTTFLPLLNFIHMYNLFTNSSLVFLSI